VHEQLSAACGDVVISVALKIFRYMGVNEENLISYDLYKGFLQADTAVFDRLYLCACELDARLEGLEYLIVKKCFFVFCKY
jgi:hypothetical protein